MSPRSVGIATAATSRGSIRYPEWPGFPQPTAKKLPFFGVERFGLPAREAAVVYLPAPRQPHRAVLCKHGQSLLCSVQLAETIDCRVAAGPSKSAFHPLGRRKRPVVGTLSFLRNLHASRWLRSRDNWSHSFEPSNVIRTADSQARPKLLT